eukprot:364078-Chlamydomonas_euryale.AAC.3
MQLWVCGMQLWVGGMQLQECRGMCPTPSCMRACVRAVCAPHLMQCLIPDAHLPDFPNLPDRASTAQLLTRDFPTSPTSRPREHHTAS